jgi:RHS repeat-associated protein
VNGATTVTVTDADNRAVLEYAGSSGALLRWYAYGAGSNDVLSQVTIGGARATMIPDIQGSVLATLDSGTGAFARQNYLPYGKSASTSITGTFGYTGQRIDPESGLYDYRARMYHAGWGRFLQVDPIGLAGGKNLYAYVGNDPLNATDSSGLTQDGSNGQRYMSDVTPDPIQPGLQYAQAAMGLCALGPGGCVAGGGITAGQLILGGAAAGAGAIILNNQGNQAATPGDKPASTPTGQRGTPIDVTPGTNQPTEIGGRIYTGHGLDQMQGRGVTPSAVEDAIQNGQTSPGNTPGTVVHSGNNGVVVVTGDNGQVITVINR